MKLIRQATIGDAQLLSSSIPETDYAAWDIATVYTVGSHAIQAHRIWESVQASNVAHDPQTAGIEWWVDIGPTNRWAMFDGVVGTLSSAEASLIATLLPGRADSVALLQVDAASVTVTMTRGPDVVYTKIQAMTDSSSVIDWFSYFFDPILTRDYLVLTDLPVFGEASITVALSKPSGTVSCGLCIAGLKSEIGGALRSPTLGINDYSQKTTDSFGNASIVPRSFAKRMGVKVILDNSDLDRVHAMLSSVRAMPVVWVGSEIYSSMLIYGFFRDFEIDIAYATKSYCTINIEGMI
jgi:hypothetical protein